MALESLSSLIPTELQHFTENLLGDVSKTAVLMKLLVIKVLAKPLSYKFS
jgi:hypothetical protein